MGNLKEIFEKQGGMQLIRRYAKSGGLWTAVNEFLLLGKSRTALEILRLAAELKTKQHLEKKYRKDLIEFDKNYKSQTYDHQSSNNVWVCWFQGMENAPDIVKICYKSLKENLSSKNIVLITTGNLSHYASFPENIIAKWHEGKITNTFMTDLLRLELLTKYGGTWIDATVLCTENEKNIPSYFFDSELFFYQCLKPGRDGHATYISSWYMNAKSHDKILEATKYLCYKYWEKNDELIDYFLLHDFISIVLDYYPDDWKRVIPRDNATPHELLLRLFDPYDEATWQAIKEQTPFHKLTYKYKQKDYKKDTYIDKITSRIDTVI